MNPATWNTLAQPAASNLLSCLDTAKLSGSLMPIENHATQSQQAASKRMKAPLCRAFYCNQQMSSLAQELLIEAAPPVFPTSQSCPQQQGCTHAHTHTHNPARAAAAKAKTLPPHQQQRNTPLPPPRCRNMEQNTPQQQRDQQKTATAKEHSYRQTNLLQASGVTASSGAASHVLARNIHVLSLSYLEELVRKHPSWYIVAPVHTLLKKAPPPFWLPGNAVSVGAVRRCVDALVATPRSFVDCLGQPFFHEVSVKNLESGTYFQAIRSPECPSQAGVDTTKAEDRYLKAPRLCRPVLHPAFFPEQGWNTHKPLTRGDRI